MSEKRTHDFIRSNWGHAVSLLTKLDYKGMRWKVAGHGHGVNVGDYLLLANGDNSTRYEVQTIEYMTNPTDQFFATIEFSPRES